MLARLTAAAIRGASVALLVAAPSLLMPLSSGQSSEVVVFMALIVGGLVFVEYASKSPSFVEFRDAPPMNRILFIFTGLCMLLLSMLARNTFAPTGLTALVDKLAMTLGAGLDFTLSPVSLVVWALPDHVSSAFGKELTAAAALAYTLGLAAVAVFAVMMRILRWPVSNGAFNVWVNLPQFDPTAGGDVVSRLRRDGWIYIGLGVALPFILPILATLSSNTIVSEVIPSPQFMIWCLSGWAMVPCGLIVRGMAWVRVSELIAQRRRSYTREHDIQLA